MAAPGVYLVGAGPGPVDLLTVRALRLIQEADVIVHDHLVGAEVLAAARPGAERIPVGKRAGGPCTPQSEIDALLVERGLRGGVVVRLKGGDPFVFGRGGEEAEALHAAGVPFEIVPGITAAIAAGAAAGIPLTHRAHSSAIVFLTGHEDPSKPGAGVRWEDYAKLNATLCVYMGVKNLPRILGRLNAAGLAPDTPAALVQCAADPVRQRVLLATAGTLADQAGKAEFASPSLAIIGPVAAFAERLQWFGMHPESDVALIDNGSLARAAHTTLREVATEIARQAGLPVTPVSWKHSDRVPGSGAWTLDRWIRARRERGRSAFTLIPFLISPDGAIADGMQRELEQLRAEIGPFEWRFTPGLTPDILARVLADRVREADAPDSTLVLVDHGGPSAASARVRDETASRLSALLGAPVLAASMEGEHGPLLADLLPGLPPGRPVLLLPLFLAPGRHAGPSGDLHRIAVAAARGAVRLTSPLGTHPLLAATFASVLNEHSTALR